MRAPTGALQRLRYAMFGEPLLAHTAEISGVPATSQPHPRDANRDQNDGDADDEEHMVSPP